MGIEHFSNIWNERLDREERAFLVENAKTLDDLEEKFIEDIYDENLTWKAERLSILSQGIGLGSEMDNQQVTAKYQAILQDREQFLKTCAGIDDLTTDKPQERLYLKCLLLIANVLQKQGFLAKTVLDKEPAKIFFLKADFRKALQAFQTQHHAGNDCIIGPKTLTALQKYLIFIQTGESETTWMTYEGSIETTPVTAQINRFNARPNIHYRWWTDKSTYNPRTNKGNFDCVQLVRFLYSDQQANRQKTSKLKTYNFREMFGEELLPSGDITPEIYRNYIAYKEHLQQIRIGDIVGFGEYVKKGVGKQIPGPNKRMSMSHGGIISRLVKNAKGEIVNAYMTHSTSTETQGPTETILFGPDSYYEKVCLPSWERKRNKKHIVCFGRLPEEISASS